jgi:hypothetical protein
MMIGYYLYLRYNGALSVVSKHDDDQFFLLVTVHLQSLSF